MEFSCLGSANRSRARPGREGRTSRRPAKCAQASSTSSRKGRDELAAQLEAELAAELEACPPGERFAGRSPLHGEDSPDA